MTEQPHRRRPTLDDLMRADQARAEAAARRLPRRGNDPYRVTDGYQARAYADPTADKAIANADRQRRRAAAR